MFLTSVSCICRHLIGDRLCSTFYLLYHGRPSPCEWPSTGSLPYLGSFLFVIHPLFSHSSWANPCGRDPLSHPLTRCTHRYCVCGFYSSHKIFSSLFAWSFFNFERPFCKKPSCFTWSKILTLVRWEQQIVRHFWRFSGLLRLLLMISPVIIPSFDLTLYGLFFFIFFGLQGSPSAN